MLHCSMSVSLMSHCQVRRIAIALTTVYLPVFLYKVANRSQSMVNILDMHAPSFAKIFSLYCSLQYGVVLQDWIEQNQIADYNIDVR